MKAGAGHGMAGWLIASVRKSNRVVAVTTTDGDGQRNYSMTVSSDNHRTGDLKRNGVCYR